MKCMTEAYLKKMFDEHWYYLSVYAYSLTGDSQAAYDISTEAFLSYYKNFKEGNDYNFLRVAVRNLCHDYNKVEGNRARLRELIEPDETIEIDDPRLDKVLQAAQWLPPARKRIFDMRYIMGFDPVEIARVLGITVDTVNVQCHRSIQFLRRTLTS